MTRFALALAAAASLLGAAEIPAGTELQIRLKTRVSSQQSKAGDPVEAIFLAPVVAAGQVWIAPGDALKGKVYAVQAAGPDGDPRASLDLDFSEWRGKKLSTRVLSVDNAREAVDDAGKITGIAASETITAQMDRGVEKISQRAGKLGEFLQVAKSAFLKKAEVDIVYEPGVEMVLRLNQAISVDKPASLELPAIPNVAELEALVNAQPFQTVAENPPKPSDITNLMFIGSRERLEAAFQAAGWNPAAVLNAQSGLETFKAVAENRGYKEAPMSILLLADRKPDLVFQKQHNTFAKRHHLRIFQRPAAFQGHPVWVCAATHDIGIEFSPENRTFIHKIDPQIDGERAKVVNDFLLTGMVKGLALAPRPAVPAKGQNATGDDILTDGAMAVLLLE